MNEEKTNKVKEIEKKMMNKKNIRCQELSRDNFGMTFQDSTKTLGIARGMYVQSHASTQQKAHTLYKMVKVNDKQQYSFIVCFSSLLRISFFSRSFSNIFFFSLVFSASIRH